MLGAIVEKLTAMSYFDYVRERIFQPLGMSSTDSYAIDDVVPNLAVGYARYEDDPLGIGLLRAGLVDTLLSPHAQGHWYGYGFHVQ